MWSMNQFYNIKQIAPSLFQIRSAGTEFCYLVLGEKEAFLADACTGFADFGNLISGLAGDRRIVVGATHGHPDHIGGALYFPECYIHHADWDLMKTGTQLDSRCGFIRAKDEKAFLAMGGEAAFAAPHDIRMNDLNEGDTFDLGGGVVVEALETPGHTRGCVTFVDRHHHCAFTGDMVLNATVLMNLDTSTNMETYRQSLLRIDALFDDGIDIVYTGHGEGYGDRELVKELIRTSEQIMAGTAGAFPHSFYGNQCLLAHAAAPVGVNVLARLDGIKGNIAYPVSK